MKKIWVNGTFDILHIGHIKLLEYASTFGKVRVGIDTDERVKQKKGESRPYNNLDDRVKFMESIKFIDSVVTFSSDDELREKIKEWEPDIMVIGDDYPENKIIGIEYIPKVIFFSKLSGYSTTNILKNKK